MDKNKILMSIRKPDHVKLRTALFMKIAVMPYEKLMDLIKITDMDWAEIDFHADNAMQACCGVGSLQGKPVLRLIQ